RGAGSAFRESDAWSLPADGSGDSPPHGSRREVIEEPVDTVLGGDPALTDRAVLVEQRPRVGELVGAAELDGVRLQLEEQAPDSLPGRLDEAGGRVDERAVEPVTERAAPVLAQAMAVVKRQPPPAAPPLGEPRNECLAEGGDRTGVGNAVLRVGDPEL